MAADAPNPTPSRRARRLLDRVLAQLDDFLAVARSDELELRVPAVSAWSVGEQLEHVAWVDRAVLDGLDRLERGEISPSKAGMNWNGRFVFFFGRIPRGAGRAPERVLPRGLDGDGVAAALGEMQGRYARLAPELGRIERAGWRLPHPVFGGLDALQWLRFAAIHHDHHWRIVQDIRRRR